MLVAIVKSGMAQVDVGRDRPIDLSHTNKFKDLQPTDMEPVPVEGRKMTINRSASTLAMVGHPFWRMAKRSRFHMYHIFSLPSKEVFLA